MTYPGGKNGAGVFQSIINLIPPHETYIETHLGSGAVLRNKLPARYRNIGIDVDAGVIAAWRDRILSGVEIVHGDCVSFLSTFPFRGTEFIYCDPPYLFETRKSSKRLYRHEYTQEDHILLLSTLRILPCHVMISGYESELYNKILAGWHKTTFEASTRQGKATETLWMNYPTPMELHDYRYLGSTFRERERIKRKKERWVMKLSKMDRLEAQSLLSAIGAISSRNAVPVDDTRSFSPAGPIAESDGGSGIARSGEKDLHRKKGDERSRIAGQRDESLPGHSQPALAMPAGIVAPGDGGRHQLNQRGEICAASMSCREIEKKLGISPPPGVPLRAPQKADLLKRPRIDDLSFPAQRGAIFSGVSSPGEENQPISAKRSM